VSATKLMATVTFSDCIWSSCSNSIEPDIYWLKFVCMVLRRSTSDGAQVIYTQLSSVLQLQSRPLHDGVFLM